MGQVRLDPFWDGASSSIRCSSEGLDATRYLDPSSHFFEGGGGRSIANSLPSKGGLRGVIIPRANPNGMGGSMGFDPQKPRLTIIDPDIKGQSCIVDISKLTKEKVNAAYKKASKDPLVNTDIRLTAAQTYHLLAEENPVLIDEPVTIDNGLQRLFPDNPHARTLISPSVSPREDIIVPGVRKAQLPDRVEEEPIIRAPISKPEPAPNLGFVDQSTYNTRESTFVPVKQDADSSPTTKVIFEAEGWGEFETYYHEVIKSDCLLVLIYNTNCKNAVKYFPPSTDRLMNVTIPNVDKYYTVHSYGNKFTHKNYEYCILIVEDSVQLNRN